MLRSVRYIAPVLLTLIFGVGATHAQDWRAERTTVESVDGPRQTRKPLISIAGLHTATHSPVPACKPTGDLHDPSTATKLQRSISIAFASNRFRFLRALQPRAIDGAGIC